MKSILITILIPLQNMNRMTDRWNQGSQIPATPNLQQYKLYGKSKAKKKAPSPIIPPTIQPISITMNNLPLTPSGHGQSTSISNNNNNNSKIGFCVHHPDKKALYAACDGKNRIYCGLCVVTAGGGGGDSRFLDEQKYQKTRTIDGFKKKVHSLKQTILTREKDMRKIIEDQQDKYGQYFAFVRQSFQNIIQSIEQKHKQLNNALIQSIQKRKQCLTDSQQLLQQIRKSLQKYISDINQNYDEILSELPLDNFRDIMKQYHTKIQYFSEHVVKKINKNSGSQTDINVYLPIQEIRRVIEKANIQYIGMMEPERIGSTRSLEKFMAAGRQQQQQQQSQLTINNNNIDRDRDREQRHNRNGHERIDRKSQSKIQQQKKKNNNTQNMVHQIRGANKQNSYLDSYYNCQHSDQRGGY